MKIFCYFFNLRSFFSLSVIADVINSVRESFLDESVDENILMELKVL
jgi:hypothetical protein